VASPARARRLDLIDWIQNRKAVEEYLEWRDHPCTRLIIDGLSAMNRARRMSHSAVADMIDPLALAEENGSRAGKDELLDLMLNLDEFHVDEESPEAGKSRIVEFMKAENYSEEQIKEALEMELQAGEM